MRQISCVLFAVMLVLLNACGSKGAGNNGATILQQPTAQKQAAPPDEAGGLTQELANLAGPADVEQALWEQLKQSLERDLLHVQAEKRPAQAPIGMVNEITDLLVVVENDGSATFGWSYRNTGDYNQDSEVNISDLTPIAVNWYADSTDGENDESEKVVDGDNNGEVSGSDISQIAIHFASTVDGYTLQVRYSDDDEWQDVAEIAFETGNIPTAGGWLEFEHNLQLPYDGAAYRVVPFFGEDHDSFGQPSTSVVFDADSLGRPQNVSASNGTIAGSIEVSWSPMSGVHFFRIFTSETQHGIFELLDSTAPLQYSYLHADLDEGEQVWYSLQGVLSGGVTQKADAVLGSTMVRPWQVENLTVSDAQFYDHTHLDWDAASGADNYRAMRTEVSGGPYEDVFNGAATTYDDHGVTPGTPYFYVVIASNDAGDGSASTEVTGRAAVPGDPPSVVSVNPRLGVAGSRVMFSALISGGPVETYAWQFGGGATPNATTQSGPTVTLGEAGEYNATLTVANFFGQHSFPFTIDVGNTPDITNVTPTTGFSGENLLLIPEFTFSVDTWAWSLNGAGTPDTSDLEQPEIVLGSGGGYPANVQATNQYGTASFDFNITVLEPPGAPGWVDASDGVNTDYIMLSWQQVPLATGYLIYRDNQDTEIATVGDVFTWNDTSPVARDFSVHTYWIVATNADGSSGFTDPDTGYIKLAPPQNIAATQGGMTDRVRLFWTGPNGATGFKIYRDVTTSAFATLGDISTWDDTNLPDYAAHTYWVSATNSNPGESDLSVSVQGYLGLEAPAGVTASQGDFADRINISWTQSTGATGYKVYRDGTSEGDLVSGELGDVASWDDTTVSDYDSHTYYVRAINALTQSMLSASASGFLSMVAPTGFAASDAAFTDHIALAWSAVNGADDYKIYRGTETNLVHTTSSGDGSTVQWDDTSIDDYETYDYWIKAFNTNGDGPSSQDAGFIAFESSWDTHAIDSSGVVGNWTSLKIIAGKPAVSYFDTVGGIKYARATTATPTQASDWTYHTVDGAPLPGGNNLGNLGAELTELNGKPFIAYHNAFTGDLQVAKANVAEPSSASDWTVYVVDFMTDVGTYPNVIVVDGYVEICYRDHTAESIKFAVANELDPLDGTDTYWNVYTLDDSGNLGYEGIDLAVVDGKPVVCYFDLTNGDLKYAAASFARPSSAGHWSISQIATAGTVGKWPSLKVLNGKPAVSFQDITNTSLLFAQASVTNPSSTSDWVAMDVDTGGTCGNFGTALMSVGGRPSIAYFFDGSQDLKYASAYSSAPTVQADWYMVDVDASASTGYYPSQIMVDGLPAISYRGGDFLMFAQPAP